MRLTESAQIVFDLERQVHHRTGRRVRNLVVEMRPERVVLHGQTATYYVKQLAQHGVRELLPQICLVNSISVVSAFGDPPCAA